MPAYVIYINGFPGVGKLTVAKALQSKLHGSKVIHNHELIDPIEKQYPRGSDQNVQKRTQYRRYRLDEVARQSETVYIFTDAQTELNVCMEDYVYLSRPPHNRRFYSVVLDCELDENVRRLTASTRGGQTNYKLTDPKVLIDIRETMEIWKFGTSDETQSM